METGSYTRSEADLMIYKMIPHDPSLPDTYVKLVPRLYSCLTALANFMNPKHSPIITVRSEKIMILVYGFVDVSGSGFGSTLLHNGKTQYRIDTWSSSEDSNSSNWQ